MTVVRTAEEQQRAVVVLVAVVAAGPGHQGDSLRTRKRAQAHPASSMDVPVRALEPSRRRQSLCVIGLGIAQPTETTEQRRVHE